MTPLTPDFTFIDTGFNATEISVRPVTDAGKTFFARHFGEAAISAVLRKSGGWEMELALGKEGLTVEWIEDRCATVVPGYRRIAR